MRYRTPANSLRVRGQREDGHMLATEWTPGSVLLVMIEFFFLFLAIWIFIAVFSDIFRRRDLSGGAKAGWIILIFLVPFLGALIYFIRVKGPQEHLRIAEDGTVTVVTEDGTPIEGYKPVTPKRKRPDESTVDKPHAEKK